MDASSTTLQRGYTLATKVQETVVTVWEIVRPVLCDDAPEGYMPAEAEDSDLDLDTKDILSFSWRALKEVRYVVPTEPPLKTDPSPAAFYNERL